jgi:hypothetical protein
MRRLLVTASGVLWVGIALLQAWPDRGFWQGQAGHGAPAATIQKKRCLWLGIVTAAISLVVPVELLPQTTSASASQARPKVAPTEQGASRQSYELSRMHSLDPSPQEFLGTSVAISGDTVVVGAPDLLGGRLLVFSDTRSGWRQTAELKGNDTEAGDNFGYSVAISGTTVVAGASGHADGDGRAYVFTKDAAGWHQTAELSGSGT